MTDSSGVLAGPVKGGACALTPGCLLPVAEHSGRGASMVTRRDAPLEEEKGGQSAWERTDSKPANLPEEGFEAPGRLQVRMVESDQMVEAGGVPAGCDSGRLRPHHASVDREFLAAADKPDNQYPSGRQGPVEGHQHPHFIEPGRLAPEEVGCLVAGPFDPAFDPETGRGGLGLFQFCGGGR